ATGEALLARIFHATTGMTGRGGVGRYPTDRKRSPVKGHITLLTKTFGKPYAGNPHVRFEEAGEGNRERVSCQVV
ncbi:MAG TPA: hypothetical protein P5321_09825, partial [Thermotogota bacterium]|nr:hypothetical protein [Thermotogota bacterium]HRU38005.1 hypothetical protein [Thermotogota bacterium]